MTVGPGKYDDLCTHVREQTEARLVMIIVVEGNRGGSGFSVQTEDPSAMRLVPQILEQAATMIRDDVRKQQQ